MSRNLTSVATFAPGVLGACVLLQLVLLRALASVKEGRVYVGGRELHWSCWFKRWLGFPCPTCGMTRSVLLTLQGQLSAAWQLNPAGLFLVCGLALFGLALVFIAFYRRRCTPHATGALQRRLRIATKVYAHALVLMLFAHWLVEIANMGGRN
ncbi:MAG TPA: DUF2752 domain-containing protein [Pyrinomonadaceae bacterium]|nr:DUF2752 domain-containing protein [Pyrinomonadaceae bacterium]